MINPVFVITGAPNKGKSTFVKAMTNDPNIAIHERSRTTKKSKAYTFKRDEDNEEPLMTIWDTPGFENSTKVHEIITSLLKTSNKNLDAFKKFIEEYEDDTDYEFEVEIFKPMLDFASIVYIADCSNSFSKEDYLREIQLLQLTNLPRIAILNPIDGDTHIESWRAGLRNHFNNIKVFNPHKTTFEEKISTLSAFSHLHDPWEKPIQKVISQLKNEKENVLRECAKIIRKAVLKIYDKEFKIKKNKFETEKDQRNELLKIVRNFVQKTMNESQSEITKRFGLDVSIEMNLDYKDNDLFDNTVRTKNVSPHERAIATAIAGTATGILIDVIAGGLTFGIFTVVLGAAGYATGYFSNLNPFDLVNFKSVTNNNISYLNIDHLNNEVGLLVINRLRQVVSNLYNRTIINTEKVIINKDFAFEKSKQLSGLIELIARKPELRYSEKNKKKLFDLVHNVLVTDQKI